MDKVLPLELKTTVLVTYLCVPFTYKMKGILPAAYLECFKKIMEK